MRRRQAAPSEQVWMILIVVLLGTILYLVTLLSPPMWVRVLAAVLVGLTGIIVITTLEMQRRKRERKRKE